MRVLKKVRIARTEAITIDEFEKEETNFHSLFSYGKKDYDPTFTCFIIDLKQMQLRYWENIVCRFSHISNDKWKVCQDSVQRSFYVARESIIRHMKRKAFVFDLEYVKELDKYEEILQRITEWIGLAHFGGRNVRIPRKALQSELYLMPSVFFTSTTAVVSIDDITAEEQTNFPDSNRVPPIDLRFYKKSSRSSERNNGSRKFFTARQRPSCYVRYIADSILFFHGQNLDKHLCPITFSLLEYIGARKNLPWHKLIKFTRKMKVSWTPVVFMKEKEDVKQKSAGDVQERKTDRQQQQQQQQRFGYRNENRKGKVTKSKSCPAISLSGPEGTVELEYRELLVVSQLLLDSWTLMHNYVSNQDFYRFIVQSLFVKECILYSILDNVEYPRCFRRVRHALSDLAAQLNSAYTNFYTKKSADVISFKRSFLARHFTGSKCRIDLSAPGVVFSYVPTFGISALRKPVYVPVPFGKSELTTSAPGEKSTSSNTFDEGTLNLINTRVLVEKTVDTAKKSMTYR